MLGVRPGAVFSEIWCCILKKTYRGVGCDTVSVLRTPHLRTESLLLCLQTQTSRSPQIPAAFVQHTEQKKAFICSALERRTASDVSGMCGKSPALILFGTPFSGLIATWCPWVTSAEIWACCVCFWRSEHHSPALSPSGNQVHQRKRLHRNNTLSL